MNNAPSLETIAGQPSWPLATSTIQAYVTQTGGHLGPVTFKLNGREVSPFNLAPWAQENTDSDLPTMLKVLRGDFFCMPFGGNEKSFKGEHHPPHGETANSDWKFEGIVESDGQISFHASLETTIRTGRVEKLIQLREGHNALYCRHIISGMDGPMNLGHHAMLKFPEMEGSGLVSTSGFSLGQVFPDAFENAEQGGYSSLKQGATFNSLDNVPMANGETADLSRYPARRGFEDLVMLQSQSGSNLGWTAVVFPNERFVWFALKDCRVLTSTVLWHSNRGRHYAPWNSRHTAVMGLEEVTSYFHAGLAESAQPNSLTKKGFRTCLELDADKPTRVNYVMAVAEIPNGFDHIEQIDRGKGVVTLTSRSGLTVSTPLDWEFLGL